MCVLVSSSFKKCKALLSEHFIDFFHYVKAVGKSITKIKLALGSCFMHPYIGNTLTIA
jgi:hypothetical protein